MKVKTVIDVSFDWYIKKRKKERRFQERIFELEPEG